MYPLRDYIDSLAAGVPPLCPQCTAREQTRKLDGKRPHGIGKLQPSIVLYNEDHKDGEDVGNVVRKDLIGTSKGRRCPQADLLLVVGTSLRVPGTKCIVQEFSKSVRSWHAAMDSPADLLVDKPMLSTPGPVVPTSSPRCSTTVLKDPTVQTICLNLDFPTPAREWGRVFDVWICGDAQAFAEMVHEELRKEEGAKDAAKERKRKREEATDGDAKSGEERSSRRRQG